LLMAIEVSIAATAMTLPLASSLFGTITLWGILLSPILVPLCGVLVGVTILWVVLPIAPLQTLVGWILEHTATTMNSLSEWAAQSGYLTAEVGISQGWCYAIYGVFLLLTLVLWALPAPREKIVFDFAVRNEPQGE
ncbi:MAG: ComEC/Rec2 family competence protein, partial [Alistipes sp.]|nr:ComEC/Rec2 family competence protein [Alistipes sp.]